MSSKEANSINPRNFRNSRSLLVSSSLLVLVNHRDQVLAKYIFQVIGQEAGQVPVHSGTTDEQIVLAVGEDGRVVEGKGLFGESHAGFQVADVGRHGLVGRRPFVFQGEERLGVLAILGYASDQDRIAGVGVDDGAPAAANEDDPAGAALDVVLALAAHDDGVAAAGLNHVVAGSGENLGWERDGRIYGDLVVAALAVNLDAADLGQREGLACVAGAELHNNPRAVSGRREGDVILVRRAEDHQHVAVQLVSVGLEVRL